MGTPTFKFFCQGRLVVEKTGAMYPTLIKNMVEEGLKQGETCTKNTTWIDYEMMGYA